MEKLTRLAHWKSIALDALRAADRGGAEALGPANWTDEQQLFGYFDCFRPDGVGVERVFADVVGGDEIVARLHRVYDCTRESFNRYLYFIVCRPCPATSERLIELTTQHLQKVRQIACVTGEHELLTLLESFPQIEITHEPEPDRRQPDYDAPEEIVYDMVGDWFRGLNPITSDALLLREAFYSMACDYNIARYLLWPLYRQSTEIEEPFAAYFELWAHGAKPWFGKPGLVTVYVSGNR